MAEQALAQALPLVLGNSDAARNQAEQTISAVRSSDPSAFMVGLLSLSANLPDAHLRKLAAVLFRRNTEKQLWDSVEAAAKESIKSNLLVALKAETNPDIKKAISEAISKLASIICASGSWAELLPVVFQLCLSDAEKQVGLALFSSLSLSLPDQSLLPILPYAMPIISSTLASSQPIAVRAAAVRVFCGIAGHVEESKKTEREALQTMLVPCLQSLADSLQQRQSQSSREILSDLIDLSASDATLLRPVFEQLLAAALETCKDEAFTADIRHLCLELFLTLCESKPNLARKIPQLVERAVPILLNMMILREADISEWASNVGDKDEEDEEEESVRFGEEALERLVSTVGGNRVVPMVLSLLPSILQSQTWSYRNSGFRSIIVLVSSADKALKGHLSLLTEWSVAGLQDDHCIVKHSAAGAIAALCTCFGPEIQNKHHSHIVPILIAMLEPSVLPRLRSRAAKCVVDFTSECGDDEMEMISHYSEGWIAALISLLSTGTVVQQCAAIPAVSALAAALQNKFSRFYPQLLPAFLSILANVSTPETRPLRGPSMECISCMADAVGSEIFAADAPRVMELLMTPSCFMASDDPNIGYLLQASSRIAQCMGQKFTPYLAQLMPMVFSLAELDPKLQMDRAEDDGCGDDEAAVVQIKGLGKMRVSINIKELEDKALGIRTLGTIANALELDFMPHLSKAAHLMVPCITYKLSESVRSAAIDNMESLLRVARSGMSSGHLSPQDMQLLWREMYTHFMNAAIAEPEADAQANLFESIAECISICGPNCLDNEQQILLCKVVQPLLEDMLNAKKATAEEDDEDGNDIDEVLGNVVEALSAAAKMNGAAWIPVIQTNLLPLVGKMLSENATLVQKQSALHILVDLIEFGGESAQPLLANVCLACIQFSGHNNSTVRRAACYGLAVCAQHGREDVSQYLSQALTALHAAVTRPRNAAASDGEDDVDETDFDAARDNAVDAVGRVCRYHGHRGQIDVGSILGTWASWLPLPADEECNAASADFLSELLEKSSTAAAMPHAAALRDAAARVLAAGGLNLSIQSRLEAAVMTA